MKSHATVGKRFIEYRGERFLLNNNWAMRSENIPGHLIKTYVWKHHGGYRQSGVKPAAG